jgi:hypothetical protein
LGQRSRKRRPPAGATPASADTAPGRQRDGNGAPTGDPVRRGYARGRERDERIRAQLAPLGPGERPLPLKLAVALAALLAIANVALWAAGWEVRGEEDQRPTGVFFFAGLLALIAVGMWRRSYLAVLGFQALLALTVIFTFLSLMVASNVAAVALCLVIIAVAGTLFWFLIRVMARIQLPSRRAEERVG